MKTNLTDIKAVIKSLRPLLSTLALILVVLSPSVFATTYTIAVVPQLPRELSHKNWGPFLYELSKQTNFKFRLLLFASFQEFESSFKRGEPDLVYLNPYHQLIAAKKQGYIPLVRDDSKMLTGILVVSKTSPIDSPADLQHQKVAFPSPLAFGASLYMRAALAKQGIEVEPVYVKSHNNVYRNVVLGTTIAGGGVNSTLQAESTQIQNALKIIYQLPGVPSHPISAHPRVDKKVTNAIVDAILNMATTPQGKELLKAINMPEPVKAVQERDYKPLESLKLERFFDSDKKITNSAEQGNNHGG